MQTQEKPASGRIIITAAIIFLAVTTAFIFIFAALLQIIENGLAYATILATLSLASGGFSSAMYVSKKTEKRGVVNGFLVGIVIFGTVTLVALFTNKSGVTVNTLFHFVIILLASLVGGILGVNKPKSKSFI